MSRGGNIQGGVHLQNQNYFVLESLNVQNKKNNLDKNSNKCHNHNDVKNDT